MESTPSGIRKRKEYTEGTNPIKLAWPLMDASTLGGTTKMGFFSTDWSDKSGAQLNMAILRQGGKGGDGVDASDKRDTASSLGNQTQAIYDSRIIGIISLVFGIVNFLLCIAALAVDIRFADEGLNFTTYAPLSMRLASYEFFVVVIWVKMGTFSGGSLIVGNFLLTFLYQMLNGCSALSYSAAISTVNNRLTGSEISPAQRVITTGILMPSFFRYMYFQSITSSLFYKSLSPIALVMSLCSVLVAQILNLKGAVVVVMAFVCSVTGLQILTYIQAQGNVIYHGLGNKDRDVTTLILSGVGVLTALAPCGVFTYAIASMAANNAGGTAVIPWFIWTIYLGHFFITVGVVASIVLTLVTTVDWFSMECFYLSAITALNIIFALSYYLGVTLTKKVDQDIGLTDWTSHPI
jgi:hypothetical protein